LAQKMAGEFDVQSKKNGGKFRFAKIIRKNDRFELRLISSLSSVNKDC
jgi:hypothetical protein